MQFLLDFLFAYKDIFYFKYFWFWKEADSAGVYKLSKIFGLYGKIFETVKLVQNSDHAALSNFALLC